MTDWSEAGRKAWRTRMENKAKAKRSAAARKAWATRRAKAKEAEPKQSDFTKIQNALLELPVGFPKPPERTKLGAALRCYSGKRDGTYDPVFDLAIRRRQPRWFVGCVE